MKTTLFLLAALLLLPRLCAEGCGCFSKVPPQPADGAYTVCAELPDKDCFWMYRAELREGENLSTFLRRAFSERHELLRQQWQRERQEEDEGRDAQLQPVPEVVDRGIMLHNPQAAEGCRDIPLPEYRDNMMDFVGNRARLYHYFLSVEFYPQGIKLRQGKDSTWGIVATAAPQWYPWERAEEFFAALPQLLQGDPAQLVLPIGLDELPCHLQQRIKSARRMVMFYADKNMPTAVYWEHWAKLVQIADPQCVEYSSTPGIILSPDDAELRERQWNLSREERELFTEQERLERRERMQQQLEQNRPAVEVNIELPWAE